MATASLMCGIERVERRLLSRPFFMQKNRILDTCIQSRPQSSVLYHPNGVDEPDGRVSRTGSCQDTGQSCRRSLNPRRKRCRRDATPLPVTGRCRRALTSAVSNGRLAWFLGRRRDLGRPRQRGARAVSEFPQLSLPDILPDQSHGVLCPDVTPWRSGHRGSGSGSGLVAGPDAGEGDAWRVGSAYPGRRAGDGAGRHRKQAGHRPGRPPRRGACFGCAPAC
jgi:hypothetical protein